jgi:hypothetical protein
MKYLVAALLIAFPVITFAGEPVQDIDALVKEIESCLLKDAKAGHCMEKSLGGRILPGNDELAKVAAQMDELLVTWLQTDKVYALHPISRKPLGDIFERRVYVIEDTSGALMLFELAFLKRLGKWYVLKFNVNSKTDDLKSLLYDRED